VIPVVDAHNDLLLELVLRAEEENPFAAAWLPQLRAGSVAVQVCPVYAADAGDAARDVVDTQIAAFERAVRENAGDVVQIRSARDLHGLAGRLGLMLSMEGVEALHGDPARFEELWEAGVRMVSLTWNYPNPFAGGIDSPEKGLTAAGRELVGSFAKRGVVLDLAHASEPTYFDALEAAPGAQVVVSHAGCRGVHDHVRNLSDEQLRALAERGGVLGMMALTLTVGRNGASLGRYLEHVDYAVESMGIEHVALGSDFIDQVIQAELAAGEPLNATTQEAMDLGGGRLAIHELVGPADYPALLEALRSRGYDGARLDAIAHGNLLRVLRAGLPPA